MAISPMGPKQKIRPRKQKRRYTPEFREKAVRSGRGLNGGRRGELGRDRLAGVG